MFTRTLLTRMFFNRTLSVTESVCKNAMVLSPSIQHAVHVVRPISCTRCQFKEEDAGEGEEKKKPGTKNPKMEGRKGYIPRQVDWQTSVRYLESDAYKEVYGTEPVWKPYRRNMKGQKPILARKTCIRAGMISTGSACPVCRDDYLVLDYRNIKLLRQFISDVTGEPMSHVLTGLCQKQIKRLRLEVAKARDHGYLEKNIPFREYDYKYYEDLVKKMQKSLETGVNQSTGSSESETVNQSTSSSELSRASQDFLDVSKSSSVLQSAVSSDSPPSVKTVSESS